VHLLRDSFPGPYDRVSVKFPARIIGIGQDMAGDDGVGLAVTRRIREIGVPASVELCNVAEPSALVPLITGCEGPVVLVDAVIDQGEPGRIVRIAGSAGGKRRGRLLSTHGVGVPDAIALALALYPCEVSREIEIVGVTIGRPRQYGEGLSPPVAAAVDEAARMAIEIARKHNRLDNR
jgi:hydrogenase maturation protease